MNSLDILVVLVWLSLTLGVGIYAGLRADAETYWVNKRSTGTMRLLFTIASTQVGAGTIMGISSATYSTGLGFGLVSLASTVTGFLALAYFAPAIKRFSERHRAITLPELFRVRYGRNVQLVAALLLVFVYISLLAVQYMAAAYIVTLQTGWTTTLTIAFAAASGIIYSAFAGIKGDIVTDTFHFWAKATVFVLLLVPLLTLRYPPAKWVANVSPKIWSPLTFGGPSFLILGVLLGFIVPLLAPELWIKVYSGRTPAQTRKVLILAAVLVTPFYAFAMYAGVLGSVVYANTNRPDILVIRLVADLMPKGLFGLGIAALYSDVVSSANTITVVISGIIFRDLFQKDPGAISGLHTSRITTAVVGVAGALMALAAPGLVRLLLNAYYMIIVVGPALVGVGVWRKATAMGSITSVLLGAMTTIVFLFLFPQRAFLPGFFVSVLAFILVSLWTKHSTGEITEPSLIFPK